MIRSLYQNDPEAIAIRQKRMDNGPVCKSVVSVLNPGKPFIGFTRRLNERKGWARRHKPEGICQGLRTIWKRSID